MVLRFGPRLDFTGGGLGQARSVAFSGKVYQAQPSRRQLLAEIWPLWFPMMVSDVTMLLNEFVNTVCLGQVGDSQQLAAVGLGNMTLG